MPLEPDINLLPKDLRDKKLASHSSVSIDEEKQQVRGFTPNIQQKASIVTLLKTNNAQSEIPDKKNSKNPVPLGESPIKPQKKEAQKADEMKKIGIMAQLKKMSFKGVANAIMHSKQKSEKTDSESDHVLGIELLPEEYVTVRSALPEIIKLAIIVCAFLIFYGGLWIYYTVHLKSIQSAGDELQKEIQSLDVKIKDARTEADAMRDSIKVITTVNTLLISRSDWERFFNRLEEITLKRVYYTALKTENGESIKLTARAPTLSDALLQIAVFKGQNDFIQEVEIEDFKVEEEEVTVASDEDSAGGATENAGAVSYTSSYVEFPISITLEPKWFTK